MSEDQPESKEQPAKKKRRSVSEFYEDHKVGIIGTVVTAFLASSILGYRSFEIVEAGNFGVRIKNGKLVSDNLEAGIYSKSPIFDTIYELRNNTIILETTAGTGRNTHEQNMLTADLRIHYKIKPEIGSIALQIDNMVTDQGKALLEEVADNSLDSVVGERHSMDHLANPQGLLQGLADNFEWRFRQNNVPAEIDSIELLTIHIGDGGNPYRIPVQLRIRRLEEGKAGWAVESMAGPAAVSVQQAGSIASPKNN